VLAQRRQVAVSSDVSAAGQRSPGELLAGPKQSLKQTRHLLGPRPVAMPFAARARWSGAACNSPRTLGGRDFQRGIAVSINSGQ